MHKSEESNIISKESSQVLSEESTSALSQKEIKTSSEETTNTQKEEESNIPSKISTDIRQEESSNTISEKTSNIPSVESTNISKEKSTNIPKEQTTQNLSVESTNIQERETTNEIKEKSEVSTNEESTNQIKGTTIEVTEGTKIDSTTKESTNKNTNQMTSNDITTESSDNKNEEESDTTNEKVSSTSNNEVTETTNKESEEESSDNNTTHSTIPAVTPTTIPTTIPAPLDKSNITLSFRQLQNFTQNDKNDITYDFYALTTEPQSKIPKNIIIYVNLIKISGEREDITTTSDCALNDIKNIDYSNQAHFICSIINLKEKYHSLRFNSSEDISGIPDDEIILDPYMTQKYINENKIDDAVKIGIPTTFIIKSIIHDFCNKNGTFTIIGNISKELNQSLEFIIPLKEPQGGIQATCILVKDKIVAR